LLILYFYLLKWLFAFYYDHAVYFLFSVFFVYYEFLLKSIGIVENDAYKI